MICNIRTCEKGTKQVKCFKTKYKNIVICKLNNKCYSITHYKTGIALSFDRYSTKKEAINDVESTVKEVNKRLKENKTTIKQFCKQKEIEQINF